MEVLDNRKKEFIEKIKEKLSSFVDISQKIFFLEMAIKEVDEKEIKNELQKMKEELENEIQNSENKIEVNISASQQNQSELEEIIEREVQKEEERENEKEESKYRISIQREEIKDYLNLIKFIKSSEQTIMEEREREKEILDRLNGKPVESTFKIKLNEDEREYVAKALRNEIELEIYRRQKENDNKKLWRI